jgi:hypothetical protein
MVSSTVPEGDGSKQDEQESGECTQCRLCGFCQSVTCDKGHAKCSTPEAH